MSAACWASQAAGNHAAAGDAAEARAEFVALFTDDAADEVLAVKGNVPDLLYHGDPDGKLEALLQAVLDAGNSDSLALRVHALREALRGKVAGSSEVALRAIKLADEHIADELDFDDLNSSALAAICPVPAFPSLRGVL